VIRPTWLLVCVYYAIGLWLFLSSTYRAYDFLTDDRLPTEDN